jgi:DNA-binding HxlR family transcriptional regulator
MPTYGQFCPVAMASEVLTERWTPLVVRELLCGSTRFNDLRRGVPLMSPSLLSKRLKTLERVGVVERRRGAGQVVEYHVTPAGEELRPIIESMGTWGQRWARGDVKARHMDASLLMWDIHRNVHVERLPGPRVVVHFHLRGSSDKKSRFWIVLEPESVDMCLADPGYDIDVFVDGHVRTMVDYWMGRIEFSDAVRSGDLRVEGPRPLVRALPTWFKRSGFAPVEMP